MKLLCVANWSIGPEDAVRIAIEECKTIPLQWHYAKGDYDHARTVTAFSGAAENVFQAVLTLSHSLLVHIDLRTHRGVHPRIGALDVCPFILLGEGPEKDTNQLIENLCKEFAGRYSVPVFLYEKSAKGGHPRDLPSLRKGEFEGLQGKKLTPDCGPDTAHPQWGVTVMGLRDWLIAANINLDQPDAKIAKSIAKKIRTLRETDARFTGVRALGFPLRSRKMSQISMNLTKPDKVNFDEICSWVEEECRLTDAKIVSTELVGVIRKRDLPKSTKLQYDPEQILDA